MQYSGLVGKSTTPEYHVAPSETHHSFCVRTDMLSRRDSHLNPYSCGLLVDDVN